METIEGERVTCEETRRGGTHPFYTGRLHPEVQAFQLLPVGVGGWGGHSTGRLRPEVQPLPFYIPVLTEKVPLSYAFHTKLHPFHTYEASFSKLFT